MPLVKDDNWKAYDYTHKQHQCYGCRLSAQRRYLKKYRDKLEKGQFIYVLTNPDIVGKVKVGKITGSPVARLRQYNVCHPNRAYEFAALVPVDNATKAEKEAHRLLAEHKFSTEWFTCPVSTAVAVVEALAK